MAEIEVDGEIKEVPSIPSHQVPAKSPNIPGCTRRNTRYVEEREELQISKMEKVVGSIYRDAFGAADVAILLAIRKMNEYVGSPEE